MQSNGEFSVKTVVWFSISGVFAILIAINGFFVKGLVEKIDKVDGIQIRLIILEQKIDLISFNTGRK